MGIEREVMEETGVQGQFQGILALREQMDYKYGAADFYIVCILKPSKDYKIDVQDTQEVSAVKWIPLSEITTNDPGSSKFMVFPSAFEYIKLLKKYLSQNEKILDENKDDVKITDLIKLQTLAHRTQVGFDSRAQKERIWNFYMPYNLDKEE